MTALRIEPKDDTPLIILNRETGEFLIEGKSMPEDVLEFYTPVLEWMKAYKADPLEKTVFDFKLIYFNTSSSKLILDVMIILDKIRLSGKEVIIRWHSQESDEDMEEAGEEYAEIIGMDFEFLTFNS